MRLQSCLKMTLLLALAQVALRAQPSPVLPTVTSYALDKSRVTLPADLSGSENLLILYFEPDQSSAALAWNYGLESLRGQQNGLPIYILPVYARENFLSRMWIGASLRSNAPDTQDRHTTIPIFVDKKALLASIGVADEKAPVVLLADKAGHVTWKQQGQYDRSKLADISAALDASAHH